MSVTTAQNLVEQAMQKSLGLNPGETIAAADLNHGFDLLNLMIDDWGSDSLLPVALIRDSYALIANKGSYTIGPTGADLTSTYIFSIDSAFIRDSNGTTYNVDVVPRETYDNDPAVAVSGNVGIPNMLTYDPGLTQETNQLGTVFLNPAPDAAYTLWLESNKGFAQFSALSSLITFPPGGWIRGIILNLCLEIDQDYGKDSSADVKEAALEFKQKLERLHASNNIKRANFTFPSSKLKNFNIMSGLEQ
jgi:hypothetical protein